MTAVLRDFNAWVELEDRRLPTTTFSERLNRFNWPLLALVLAVSGVGLFNQYVVGQTTPNNFFWEHLLHMVVGLVAFVFVSLIDVRLLRQLAFLGAVVALILLLIVQNFGLEFNQSTRWMRVGSFTLQPSEIAQVALVVYLASYLENRSHEQLGNPLWLIPPALIIGSMAYLIFEQPDLGTTLKLLLLMGLMILCSGIRWWFVILIGLLIVGLGAVLIRWPDQFLKPYQIDRLTCFVLDDSEIELLADASPCDQPRQARIAIGGAGIWGHGPLEAPQLQSLIIYEPYNDMILAVHAEQFGLAGTLALLALIATLVLFGFGVAVSCRAQFTRFLALGAAINFGLYATINFMMVLSLLPVVGMPLALMSKGGTVTVIVWASFGLINSAWINRHLTLETDDQNLYQRP